MKYEQLEMQNYLNTLDIDITNEERKIIFQLRNKMYFKIKTHFRNMCENTRRRLGIFSSSTSRSPKLLSKADFLKSTIYLHN